jgi:hypothetical protein
MTSGRNPYASSRKPLTSSHPSSADRNFDGAVVASGGFEMITCAPADDPQSTKAVRTAIA